MGVLNKAELERALSNLPDWTYDQGALFTSFVFQSFEEAIDFVGAVAELAITHQHHPTIVIEYTRVTLELTTHDADDKVTDKDLSLAHAIDDLELDYEAQPDYFDL